MNKETIEVIRKMESEMIKAISAVVGELELADLAGVKKEGIDRRPIAMTCETNAVKSLLGSFNTIESHAVLGPYTATHFAPFLRQVIELLVATNKRIDKLEEKLG